MAIDIYMVITDQNGSQIAGESLAVVLDPYSNKSVTKPVEVMTLEGTTEQTYSFGTTGGGGGKVVFDPFVITKRVDAASQASFLAHASGIVWRYVDLLFVNNTGSGTTPLKPFLSYRLGTVGISEIATTSDGDSVAEKVSLVFGQLQIGYQATRSDGTLAAFTPVGWDRVKNVKI